jgi:hypothetical protein
MLAAYEYEGPAELVHGVQVYPSAGNFQPHPALKFSGAHPDDYGEVPAGTPMAPPASPKAM